MKKRKVKDPTEEEKHFFIGGLSQTYPDSGILMAFMPKRPAPMKSTVTVRSLPSPLSSYYHPKYQAYTNEQLLNECERIFKHELKLTEEESKYLAASSKLQSQSSVWWNHKIGRLTSSKFFAVCRTSISKPAASLVNNILFKKLSPKVQLGDAK